MKKFLYLFVTAAILLAACGVKSDENSDKDKTAAQEKAIKEQIKADSIAAVEGASQNNEKAPSEEPKDASKKSEQPDVSKQNNQQAWDSAFIKRNSGRKLIKTANLVFSVASVERATVNIENLAQVYGGFILSSGIKEYAADIITQRVNKDSVLEVGIKSIENNITLRVPEFLLDSVLFQFSKLWIDLDERTITAQDVTIDFLANELRARMYQKTATNINKAAQNNQKDLGDVVNAETQAAAYLESTIQKKIDNLTLQDKIDYATITLRIYQDNALYKKRKVSHDMQQYEPGFGYEFVESLKFGWKIIVGLVLFLTKAWSVLLIMFILFLVIYYPITYSIKRKKKKAEAGKQ